MWTKTSSDRLSDEDMDTTSGDGNEIEEEQVEEIDDRGNKRVQLSSLQDARIRVGKDYQAKDSPFIKPEDRIDNEDYYERSLLIWTPTDSISDKELEDYMEMAKDKYGYNSEQSLGLLFWHKYDLDKAKKDLQEYAPHSDEWTAQDRLLFETAFEYHGKSFRKLQQMLPDKTIASLVKFYYLWKKTNLRQSYIDKTMEKFAVAEAEEKLDGWEKEVDGDAAKESGTTDSEVTYHKPGASMTPQKHELSCTNCAIAINIPHQTPFGNLCSSCYKHWWVTGNQRPLSAEDKDPNYKHVNGELEPSASGRSGFLDAEMRHKLKIRPPEGIAINHDDLLTIGMQKSDENRAMMKELDKKIGGLRKLYQQQKQWLAANDDKRSLDEETYYEVEFMDEKDEENGSGEDDGEVSAKSGSSNGAGESGSKSKRKKWGKDELFLIIEGFRRFGITPEKIVSILDFRSERELVLFLNSANASGYTALFLEAMKEYENYHGRIPDTEQVRSLIFGKWTLPLPPKSPKKP